MPDSDTRTAYWVDSADGLAALCDELAGADRLAIDTEFHGERSYWPHLMLVQVATERGIWLVDPRAEDVDIGSLFGTIASSGALVIGHALQNDLEIVAMVHGLAFPRVFDTQIAAAFCGHGLQIGLSSLVHAELGVRPSKGAQLADWSRRPLPERQFAYAADDVRYLLRLHELLGDRLAQAERAAWVEAECASLSDLHRYDRDASQAWTRVSGARRLGPRDLGVLRELAAERDAIAREVDMVPHFLVPDDLLLAMVREASSAGGGVFQDRRLQQRNILRHGERFRAAIARGLAAPLHLPPGRPPPEGGVEAVAGLVMLLVQEVAAREGVAAQMILRRKQVIEALQLGCEGGEQMLERMGVFGWRRQLVGAAVCRLMRGGTHARVNCPQDSGEPAVEFVEPT